MKTTFGEWLKAQIKQQDMNQSELAAKIRVHPPQVSRIISGERTATTDILVKISDALRLPRETVLGAAGILPPETDDPWVDEMSYKLSRLSPGLRRVAERFINSMLEGEEAERIKPPQSKPRSVKV